MPLWWYIVAGFLFFVICWYFYMGHYIKIKFREAVFPGGTFIFRYHIGGYETIHKSWADLESKIKANKVPFVKSMVIYYDQNGNKQKIADKDRHSLISYMVKEDQLTDAVVQKLQAAGLGIKRLPAARSMSVVWPYRNMIAGIVGCIKVYGSSPPYKGNAGAVELYDFFSTPWRPWARTMTFYFPQENTEAFSLPESERQGKSS
jgi:hypothetical protein